MRTTELQTTPTAPGTLAATAAPTPTGAEQLRGGAARAADDCEQAAASAAQATGGDGQATGGDQQATGGDEQATGADGQATGGDGQAAGGDGQAVSHAVGRPPGAPFDAAIAREALRARDELLERVAETVPAGLASLDAERRVTWANTRVLEMLAIDGAETAEQLFPSVAEGDRAALHRAVDAVLAAGDGADVEVALRVSPEGELRFCVVSVRALAGAGGEVAGALVCVADVTDRGHMRAELERRASFDPLTGCFNRASIMLALDAEIASAKPGGDRAVMLVGVDGFDEVAERGGDAARDELLRALVGRLEGVMREGDLLGRLGDGELLLVCSNVGSEKGALRVAERIAQTARCEVETPAGTLVRTASVGVAWSRGPERSADELVAEADAAAYAAKSAGGARATLASAEAPAAA